jgi:hypothetical protein
MNVFLAPDIWPLIAIAILWWLASLFPVVYPTLVALRRKPVMPRRLLFISVVVGLSYGCLVFFQFVIVIPLDAFGTYIAPQLKEVGELPAIGQWSLEILDKLDVWWWKLVVPLILAAVAFKLTRYLAPDRITPLRRTAPPGKSRTRPDTPGQTDTRP